MAKENVLNAILLKQLLDLEHLPRMSAEMLNALQMFVNMEDSVLLCIIGRNVSVLLDLLEQDVKSMLMNAQVPLVTMEQPVLICHKDTGVIVLMVILVFNVKKKIQIVINNFAQVKQCAETNPELEITLVFANLVTREMLVILLLILVKPVLVKMEPLAMLSNKADIHVLVLQDGKVPFVIKTLMTVPKILVFLVSTVLI